MIKTVSNIRQIDIAEDIRKDLNRSFTEDRKKNAEKKVLQKMDEIKNRQTRQGESPAKGGRWNNLYNRQYARREKGGRRSPVTMRNRKRSIEKTETISSSNGSKLVFRNGRKGRIFYYHDTGTAKGGKFRQIYPKADNQVPKELDIIAEREVFKILSGKVTR